MAALVTLLFVIMISITVVRIGAVALTMTGLSRDAAMFQAQSAFSGTGFTTAESESVVSHPIRRKIIRLLMLTGNAGLTTAVATLVLTFYGGSGRDTAFRVGIIAVGTLALWWLSSSKFFDRIMTRIIKVALARWTALDITDYARLLEVEHGYSISEIFVEPNDWLCGKTLSDLRLNKEGILVLGIRKADGTYIGAAAGETEIRAGDTLTCYGRERLLKELPGRPAGEKGDASHAKALEEQEQTLHQQREDEKKP